MVALYIILGILAVIALLLFIPIKIKIEIVDSFEISIKYLFLRFSSEPDSDTVKKTGKKKTRSDQPPKKGFFEQLREKEGFIGAVKSVTEIAVLAIKKFTWLLKKAHVKKFRLKIIVAGDDAAQTGIMYGAVCATVYPILGFLNSLVRFDERIIEISADFNSDKPSFGFYSVLNVYPIYALIALFSFVIQYISLKPENNKSIIKERK